MRLGTVRLADGTTSAAALDGAMWRGLPAPDLSALLASGWTPGVDGHDTGAGPALADATALQPLPTPGKVICCGLNYGEHIAETGRERPAYPTLFAKYADTLLGDGEDLVLLEGVEGDWEAELTVVVGAPIRGATRTEAQAAVLGYTVANDISIRDWQRRTLQWFQGKAWDRTTPLGPVVVTADELDPVAGVDVVCRLNGEEMQRDSTRTLVFDVADLLAYVSTFTTLRPGDLVLTGTPGGVGMARHPRRFLADGDVLETEVVGIGTLTNTVRIESRTTLRSSPS